MDLNADTYPDIYDVNYLKDEEKMFDRLCPDSKGKPRICPPIVFDCRTALPVCEPRRWHVP